MADGDHERPLSFDALVLVILTVARVRIDTLATLAATRPEETVRSLPVLGNLLSAQAWDLMRNWLTDPITLVLVSVTFALVGLYLLVDALRHRQPSSRTYRLKLGLLLAIVLITVVCQSLFLVLMRRASGPASYTHDGGVIQTEAAIDMLLRGENPYTEDFLDTPVAEWGLEKRTALYHYPYLPWTLVASVPARLLCELTLGWYDQRLVYLALFVATLLLLPGLTRRRSDKLTLVAIVGLNPIMGNDIIYGMNDSFVLAWVVLSLWLLAHERYGWSAVAMGLAWASKPTAWFVAPFYLLYLARGTGGWVAPARQACRRIWPAALVAAALIVPFVIWDPVSFYDDVWAWAAGTSATPYQIRGWGLSNLVLAFGLVSSDQDYFPFWIGQVAVCVPLLLAALRLQLRHNTMQWLLYGYAALFTAYSFLSRFFNENYAGIAVALFALAALVDLGNGEAIVNPPDPAATTTGTLRT